ncbi:MoxR-like ATPase [Actinoplanes italicus]|uniref:MoxR-like ATPase n=1 Tax=Actinoplanes italicus TaxID=113567 RepID=A0A2T0KLY9_9ACTN|nr:MoxR family ATPase [Actinoplanes italicus]PRX24646.1 MoxR-like ATPase [Actinoplanes italicus]GIE27625.1 MoxR-like ATPase [Actinoplanes italicus]
MDVVDAKQLEDRLNKRDYFPDEGLVAAAVLAQRLRKPVFLEGEPGVGKSTFAEAMAGVLDPDAVLIRLQCHSGLDAGQALYDWDFPRQVLTLRAADRGDAVPVTDLYRPEFLVRRPVLAAFEKPSVLLIDEIDRADDEFEACLLEVLDKGTISIPELGPEQSGITMRMPFIVLTSNDTREVHGALKRRCIYHWIEHPKPPREAEILEHKIDGLTVELAAEIAEAMKRLRADGVLTRPPGVAEAIDLARSVVASGAKTLAEDAAISCAGAVAKHRDDVDTVRRVLGEVGRDSA